MVPGTLRWEPRRHRGQRRRGVAWGGGRGGAAAGAQERGVGAEGRGGRGGVEALRGPASSGMASAGHGPRLAMGGCARACQQSRGACRSRRSRRPVRHRWRACRTVPPTRLRRAGWAFGRAGGGRGGPRGRGRGPSEARAGGGTGRGGAGAGAGVGERGPRRELSSDQAERVRSGVAAGYGAHMAASGRPTTSLRLTTTTVRPLSCRPTGAFSSNMPSAERILATARGVHGSTHFLPLCSASVRILWYRAYRGG